MSVSGALLLAWSNGANDAANSMGGAVGAGSLTLRQAVIGGAVAELAGAALMGVHVSKTISKGVIQATDYLGSPEEFAFLFFAVTVGFLLVGVYWPWNESAALTVAFRQVPICTDRRLHDPSRVVKPSPYPTSMSSKIVIFAET